MLALPDVLPDLVGDKLVRLLSELHSDAGMIPLTTLRGGFYPGKTRVFIDFAMEDFWQLG
ncbi:hypothetical protein B0G75_13525 [Paraburkholderia sp. BL18I3N2]|uniref:hypothetical protein n=1 Tax=Paraburkholderia sp. BL18I3N2 TaxID=1938799 RepID=UPI000D077D95|nr:hypothetical protein [Paraburkholderia sp. BL18I3N2]PRX20107.1 hypothetical protein B0G75_13525 [Paraburkholderia sp. BL18I3N2]